MRLSSVPATLACATLTFLVAQPTDSYAFLGLFEKKSPEAVPQGSEREKQESEASAIMDEARESETRGKVSSAVRSYKRVVTHYPLTSAAAQAQFQIGELKFVEDEYLSAFYAFQDFVENYPQSNLFNQAIERQFEIAEISKTHKKRSFIGIKMKMRNSDLIEMYETIIKNAPYSVYAPKAQFSLAEVYDHQDKSGEAIASYQAVVENYPSTAEAKEAQFRIGQVNNAKSLKSQDASSLRAAQEAMQSFVIENPSDTKAKDAEAILGGLDNREADRAFEIAQFYEEGENPRAAAIYYQEVLRFPNSPHYAKSRERLSEILNQDGGNLPEDNPTPPPALKVKETEKVVVSSPSTEDPVEATEPERKGLSRFTPGFLRKDEDERETEIPPAMPVEEPAEVVAEAPKVKEVAEEATEEKPSVLKRFTPMIFKKETEDAKEEVIAEKPAAKEEEKKGSGIGGFASKLFGFGKGEKDAEEAPKEPASPQPSAPQEVVKITPPAPEESPVAPVKVETKVVASAPVRSNGEAPLKASQNYVGPPPPDLERLLKQPKPRMDVEEAAPKPLEIPAAPSKPTPKPPVAPTETLAIPPAPEVAPELPLPPAPSE